MVEPALLTRPGARGASLQVTRVRPAREALPYNPALDGIRAIAILAVLIFHLSPAALGGGFSGVDVFFVLSGFLVTSIIIRDVREGRFSLKEFYLRRIQRLLPNLLLMVLTVMVLAWCLLPASSVRQTAAHSLWTLFSASNIYVWRFLGGYWGDSAEYAPLTHTWSLGIEEQFYLCFPSLLLLLARFQPARLRAWVWGGVIVSFGACVYGTYTFPSAAFYLLPTRFWELLLGALVALHRTPLRHETKSANAGDLRTRSAMGWAGLAIVFAGFVLAGADIPFPGWLSLFPTLGTVLLILAVSNVPRGGVRGAIFRLLGSRPMVAIGRCSYSLYLWHWPLITVGKIEAELHAWPPFAGAVAGCVAAIFCAWGAYIWVEQPLRRRGQGRTRRIEFIGLGFAGAFAVSAVVASRDFVPDPQHRFDPVTFSGKLYNAGPLPTESPTNSIATRDVIFPAEQRRTSDPWRNGGIIHRYGGERPEVVVLGSSHALMYSKVIDDLCRDAGISVAFLGADAGTPAFFEAHTRRSFSSRREADEFDAARRRFLREWRPEIVFVIDRWDETVKSPDEFDRKLRSFLSEVCPLADRVELVTQVPVHRGGNHINLREQVSRLSSGSELPRLMPDLKDNLRRAITRVAEAATRDYSNLEVLRADRLFYNKDGSIRYASGRSFFYADDDHLSDSGSEVVRPLFRRALEQAGVMRSGD